LLQPHHHKKAAQEQADPAAAMTSGGIQMGRLALVTGGTRGIGAAISKALKTAGYQVAANYAGNDDAAQKFKAETGIPVYKWDVGDYDACAAGIRQIEADLGPVEVLVNNAGITRDGMFHKMTKEQWSAVIRTNLDSLFNMTHQVWEGMRNRNFGRVIVISSVNGQKGQMGQVNYSAAKAGDLGFIKALAQEGAIKNITVNAICPGWFQTEMIEDLTSTENGSSFITSNTPMMRVGQVNEIDGAVLLLASDAGSFMTGSIVMVDGGWTAR
jgi:acetoacetyl-CoA reductase